MYPEVMNIQNPSEQTIYLFINKIQGFSTHEK